MSRTRSSGGKGPGYDFWSRRPMSGRGYGPSIKKCCRRIERARGKQSLHKEVTQK